MARAIWSGSISFGLVNIGVRLFPATRRRDVRFNEIDSHTGQRVRHQRVVPAARFADPDWALEQREPARQSEPVSAVAAAEEDESATAQPGSAGVSNASVAWRGGPEPVAAGEIVKGFQVAPDQYVVVSRHEIEQLRPERTRRIDIEQFVPWEQIDAVHFDSSYHVAPQREYERPFRLLSEALATEGKAGISWIVLRQKRHLAALRSNEGLLMLSTMFHADELLAASDVAPAPAAAPSEREMKMARLLIASMSGDFEAARYEDDYRRRLLELIASRSSQAKSIVHPFEEAASSGVEDLMAALEASLRQVQERTRQEKDRIEERRPPRRKRGGGAA